MKPPLNYISRIIELLRLDQHISGIIEISLDEEGTMQLEEVAKAMKELGHPTRLFIFKHLVKAGEQGLPVGDLQKQLAIPSSTLSHHISARYSRECDCSDWGDNSVCSS